MTVAENSVPSGKRYPGLGSFASMQLQTKSVNDLGDTASRLTEEIAERHGPIGAFTRARGSHRIGPGGPQFRGHNYAHFREPHTRVRGLEIETTLSSA